MKKYHFTYKTINLINSKYYFGVHSTNNLNDGYLGSGTNILKAIQKYGKENFKLIILEHYESRDEANKAEFILVDKTVVSDINSYNMIVGGQDSYMLNKVHSLLTIRKLSNATKGKIRSPETRAKMSLSKMGNKNPWYNKQLSDSIRAKMSLSRQGENHPMFGKHHTEEAKLKISISQIGKRIKDKHHKYDNRSVIGTNILTGEEIWFESKLIASRQLGLKNSSGISSSCKTGKTAGGYYWRYNGENIISN